MFDCGITVSFGQMTTQIENAIVTAVQRVGIDVDKERLEEVLFDARGNYERGFREGQEQAARELVHCRDCKHQDPDRFNDGSNCYVCRRGHGWRPDDWYCADGERR